MCNGPGASVYHTTRFPRGTLRNPEILSMNFVFQAVKCIVVMIGRQNIFYLIVCKLVSYLLNIEAYWYVGLCLYSCLGLLNKWQGWVWPAPQRGPSVPFSRGNYYPDSYDSHFFVFLHSFNIQIYLLEIYNLQCLFLNFIEIELFSVQFCCFFAQDYVCKGHPCCCVQMWSFILIAL